MSKAPTISLCVFVKDEPQALLNMLFHTFALADEIIIVNTDSSHGGFEKLKESLKPFVHVLGMDKIRMYNVGFTNFGDIRTMTAHLATKDWVLMLDADEMLSENSSFAVQRVINDFPEAKAFGIPRKRWADLDKKKQVEQESFPDYQVRLFKNDKNFCFKRELHEYFHGAAVVNLPPSRDLQINHFHDVFKTKKQLEERKELYERLSTVAGVEVEGGKPKQFAGQLSLFDI